MKWLIKLFGWEVRIYSKNEAMREVLAKCEFEARDQSGEVARGTAHRDWSKSPRVDILEEA